MKTQFKRIKRRWCRIFHRGIMFAGGRTYQCRRCGERFESPAFDGPAPRVDSSGRRLAAILEL